MEPNTKEYYELQSEYWFNENAKHIKERDEYKSQRDELINDIADIKRKAEAFDDIKQRFITSGYCADEAVERMIDFSICKVEKENARRNISKTMERGSDE
ncbi:hypothetical protein MT340_009145 [Staphylococcus sp. NRL 16/872]|uniref:hypothetical protein n=1 Tax=Staphylococcus sp. NRL 16/872 TaxID=2930131 RepID=UPI001FB20B7F|nr:MULTISPECIES: hypothetical protein [unclassified Staphylococcus]WEN70590.1 hypothetical protein MT340_009145 [Staphylococcus sp. NRL 16/872]